MRFLRPRSAWCCSVEHPATEVPLTAPGIKCSLGGTFSIVNIVHGTHGPAPTRNGTTRKREIVLQHFLSGRLAPRRRHALPPPRASHDSHCSGRVVASQNARLCRTRLSRR